MTKESLSSFSCNDSREQYKNNILETAYFAHLERRLRAASGSLFDQQLLLSVSPEELARRDYIFGEQIEQSPNAEGLKQLLKQRREDLELHMDQNETLSTL